VGARAVVGDGEKRERDGCFAQASWTEEKEMSGAEALKRRRGKRMGGGGRVQVKKVPPSNIVESETKNTFEGRMGSQANMPKHSGNYLE
jgi:hypothetical protein